MSEFPFAPNNGVRADIWGRIRAMNHLGYSVDVVVTKQKPTPGTHDVTELQALISSLQFVERRSLGESLARIVPTAIARNRNLAKVPLPGHYDLTLAEGE